ncbi:MAG: hypothetical protein ACOYMR_10990 [Ilumatobacteraceae bacterium]
MTWNPVVAAFAVPAVAVTLSATLVACSDEPARTEGSYCTEVGNHLAALNSPALGSQQDVTAMLDEWRAVAAVAPLAVQPEWEALVANVEAAAAVDPNDADAVQQLADSARQTEPAANRVIAYTQSICGVTIGKVKPTATTAPAGGATTTVAPKG